MSKMLYRRGGDQHIHGVDCDTRIVDGPEEEDAARADGFADYGEVIAGAVEAPKDGLAQADPAAVEAASQETERLRSDLQAAAELLDEERQAHAQTKTALDEANDRIADLQREVEELKVRIAPFDADGDDKPGGGVTDARRALRAELETLTGKKAFGGWDEAELQRRIDEAKGSGNGAG